MRGGGRSCRPRRKTSRNTKSNGRLENIVRTNVEILYSNDHLSRELVVVGQSTSKADRLFKLLNDYTDEQKILYLEKKRTKLLRKYLQEIKNFETCKEHTNYYSKTNRKEKP